MRFCVNLIHLTGMRNLPEPGVRLLLLTPALFMLCAFTLDSRPANAHLIQLAQYAPYTPATEETPAEELQAPPANRKPVYTRGQSTVDSTADDVAPAKPKKVKTEAAGDLAVPVPGAGRSIDYVAVQQPLDQALRELGQAAGVRVVASDGVKGTVRKRHLKGELPMLLDKLAQEFGLFWFPDGGAVYVEALDEQKTKVVKLKNVGREQIYEAMDQAGLSRAKSRVQVSDGSARVVGSDNFHKTIEDLLASLAPPEDPDIKIIKYGTKVSN